MKNLQKGSMNVVLIVIIIALLIVVGYFVFMKQSQNTKQLESATSIPENTNTISNLNTNQVQVNTVSQTPSENELIQKLLTSWKTVQLSFSSKAGESGTFNAPSKIQFISSDTMLVNYDDGLVDHVSVVRYKNNSFTELKNVGVMSTMSMTQWQGIVSTYGNAGYAYSNYQSSNYKNFSKVSSNIFVR
jgi:uncharacterized protein YneF (UPF0154 family)